MAVESIPLGDIEEGFVGWEVGAMTVNEALAIVASKAAGRTRYEGQKPFLDEVLAAEITRLREIIEQRDGEEDAARQLITLLLHDVLIINSNHWRHDLPAGDRRAIFVGVICNDTFAWATADAELLPHAEIGRLYEMWRRDQIWGPAVWCAMQRREWPIEEIAARIKMGGAFDLNEMAVEFEWKPNQYEERSRGAYPSDGATLLRGTDHAG